MSTLQVANLHFESTGNNRIEYAGSNVVNIIAGGTTVLSVNSITTVAKTSDFLGQQTIWMPATAMTPTTTNGATFTTITVGDVQVNVLAFDPTTGENASFVIQMPKSWNEGTIIFQPVWAHPATTTNFGVFWGLNARAYSNDDAPASFSAVVSSADTGGTTNDVYIGPESGSLTIDGTPAAEDLVIFKVFRLPSDASDTMAVDAYLYGIKIHYTVDAGKDD
jgi:hypothetical protein